MSLNYKEIDLILEEITSELNNTLSKVRIQKVYQPEIQTLYMELYKQKKVIRLYFCLSEKQVRFHTVTKKYSKPKKPQRFQQLLQSKIEGSSILSCSHIDENRIIRFHLLSPCFDDKNKDIKTKEYFLYFKLWSNNSNIILTNTQNRIIDLLYRSPKQELMPKNTFVLPMPQKNKRHTNTEIRKWTGTSFNNFVATFYASKDIQSKPEHSSKDIQKVIDLHFLQLSDKHEKLTQVLQKTTEHQKYLHYGNAILEQLHTVPKDVSLKKITMLYKNEKIPLTATLSLVENAQKYFDKAQKSQRSYTNIQKRIAECNKEIKYLKTLQEKFVSIKKNILEEKTHDILEIDSEIDLYLKSRTKKQKQKTPVKKEMLNLTKNGFIIFIGRNAKENDFLLRHVAKGDDMWMHVLNNRSAFVFIRPKNKSKSIPLDLLLECAQLTALYSKVKKQATVDVCYTKTKYLRRVKKSLGSVIASQTKTLHIAVNETVAKSFIDTYKTHS